MKIRKAARTVIFDEEKRIAILEVDGGDHYKIPGGGIDEGETEEQAARREAAEEAGCEVRLLEKIGESEYQDPQNESVIHHSVCFLAEKTNELSMTNFTGHENARGFRLMWLPIDESIALFESTRSTDPFGVLMNKRDLEFVRTVKNNLLK